MAAARGADQGPRGVGAAAAAPLVLLPPCNRPQGAPGTLGADQRNVGRARGAGQWTGRGSSLPGNAPVRQDPSATCAGEI